MPPPVINISANVLPSTGFPSMAIVNNNYWTGYTLNVNEASGNMVLGSAVG